MQNFFEHLKMPVFPIFMVMIVVFAVIRFKIKNAGKHDRDLEKDFWDRENEANAVRAVDITTLDYITIPLDTLPLHVTKTDDKPEGDSEAEECARVITAMSEKKVLNLTGKTNTDLKYEYGPGNLDFMMQCDENFTILVRSLGNLGVRLDELGHGIEAMVILEYAVSIGSDIKKTYTLLGEIYARTGSVKKLEDLKKKAEELPSLSKTGIINALNEL